jgi:lactate dehydrogenase-like 2-hydroxyacid dehydrogenase
MARPVVWIPRRLSEATLARARRDYDVIVNDDDMPGSADEIVAMSARVDAMIPCHSERFSADVVARLDPRLRIVANHSVGTDHCDLPALKARGIAVTNTPGVLSDATAELAMMLMLGAARHAVAGDRIVRSGTWDFWSPAFLVGKQVTGARLGIVGMGGVGRAFARKARGFDMEIHYHNRRRLPRGGGGGRDLPRRPRQPSGRVGLPLAPLPGDARNSGPDERRPSGTAAEGRDPRERLPWVAGGRSGASAAIESGHLAGAGLDCFVTEPGGNPAFAAHETIVMMPHVGSATVRTRDAMGFKALDNLDAFFAGRTPPDLL